METKGWDVFRSLPPETDSSSEAVDKWLGTTVKILKVRKPPQTGIELDGDVCFRSSPTFSHSAWCSSVVSSQRAPHSS